MKPKVTVCLGSWRPGGVDISLRALAAQDFSEPWELVFVDRRYHSRHQRVVDYARECGLLGKVTNFVHVPHHRDNGDWANGCAGWNTGFALARGEYVAMLMDWAHVRPDWIRQMMARQVRPRHVMAPHVYLKAPEMVTKDQGRLGPLRVLPAYAPETTAEAILTQRGRFDEISCFSEPMSGEAIEGLERESAGDPKVRMPEGSIPYTFCHTKAELIPTEAVLDVGGMDERFDTGRGPGDMEFCWRLQNWGLEVWNCPAAMVFCPNPRWLMPSIYVITKDNERAPPPYDKHWNFAEGLAYANSVIEKRRPKAENPKDLRQLSKELEPWRGLSQEKEPVIPLNVVADQVYWPSEVRFL